MDRIDEIIYKFINELDYPFINDMFARINSGKKLRSKLLLKIAGESDETFRLCAIIELIHLASLLHDDVIDEAQTRRSNPSINALFGTKNSVMLGDILYSKGFFELSKFDTKIAQSISDAVSKLSIGELMDVKMGESFNENKELYFKMIYYKTAILIEATASCGAFLAGLCADDFKIYGKNLGIAFQIVDDILDITQSSELLGKPSLNDFKEGKTTLPYIYLYENLPQNEREMLRSYRLKELNQTEKQWIKDKFKQFNIIEKSIDEAKKLGAIALKSIEKYKNNGLNEIVLKMIDREF